MPSFRPIVYVIGLLLCVLALAMLLPALVDIAVGNPDWKVFASAAVVTGFVGGSLALTSRGAEPISLSLRQGFLLTAGSWLVLTAFAALPFAFFAGGLDYTDAFFEAISGLTTTGSTVIIGLDGLAPGILLWRSLLQWVGGVGIIVMAIIVLPFLRVGGMQLFHTESSARSEKIVARPAELVGYIALSYLILTAACALLYGMAGMSGFDAINHAMTTLATGGYSTHDASIAHFESPAIEWISTAFMLAGALPFVVYIQLLRGRTLAFWHDTQVRVLIAFLLAVSLLLALDRWLVAGVPFSEGFRAAAFNVTSVVTTTGYVSADYGLWSSLAVAIFLVLTVIGGCAGSTSGGIKIYRHQVLWIVARDYLRQLVSPHRVLVPSYAGQRLPADVPPAVLAFVAVFLGCMILLALGLAAFGLDLITALSGAATALANVGPGLGPVIGPAGNFADLPDGAKWLLSFGMLLGRLELFTVLVLFNPRFWRY